MRLLIVLNWLRHHQKLSQMRSKFNVSERVIMDDIKEILPILVEKLNFVNWPEIKKLGFEDTVGSIDCTCHYKNRTHPKEADYYRGDKHRFFIGSDVVVGENGQLYHFLFFKGHNNDQGIFNKSKVKRKMILEKFKLLADGGYKFRNLVTPDDEKSANWNNQQKSSRSIVEITIGLIKTWSVASKTVFNIEIQEMALYVVYQLQAMKLLKYPLRQ